MPELRPWDEIWWVEGQAREEIDPKTVCHFGIKHLDDQIPGILKNELLVIGADSGVGKSEVAINMAIFNATEGKRVALFFIEGGATEAMARIKWKCITELYYTKYRAGIDMNYTKWRMNAHDKPELLKKIEEEALSEMKRKMGSRLEIYSFQTGFTVQNLTEALDAMAEQKERPDIIIIDHLQYFTLTNPKNEFQEVTDILMKVKDVTNHRQIPVVLVSHLRKKDKDRGLPSQEDFFGTSNTAKICSLAITISPWTIKDDYKSERYPTFFRVVKSRVGLRSSTATLCNYDFKKGKYENEYIVYKLKGDHPEASPILPTDLPAWARKKHAPKCPSANPVSYYDGKSSEEDGVYPPDVQRGDNAGGPAGVVEDAPISAEDINWEP